MHQLGQLARTISDKRSDIRLGIFLVSQIAIIIRAKYTLAIVSGLTFLAIILCCCRIYAIRQQTPEAPIGTILRQSLYSIIFSAGMLTIWLYFCSIPKTL